MAEASPLSQIVKGDPNFITQAWVDADTVVLKRLDSVRVTSLATPAYDIFVVDTETTGTDPDADEPIEIGICHVRLDADFHVCEHVGSFGWFRDTRRVISEEATRVHGIDKSQIAGQHWPCADIRAMITGGTLPYRVVAQNAGFDYNMLRFEPELDHTNWNWACSLQDIDWPSHGYRVRNQEILAIYHGFIYRAHRAVDDVNALANLLNYNSARDGSSYFRELWTTASNSEHILLHVVNTQFQVKDQVKSLMGGAGWEPQVKGWWKVLRSHAELVAMYKAFDEQTFNFNFRTRFLHGNERFNTQQLGGAPGAFWPPKE